MSATTHRAAGQWGWLRPSRALLALGLLLVAAIAGFVAWSGWLLRNQALTGAERQLSNLSLVLEEQTSRSLHSVDMVLADAVERMQRIGDLQFARGSSLLQSTLRERAGMLTMIDSLQVLDHRGVLMVDTRRFPSPLESMSGSELFRAHAREGVMEHLGEAPWMDLDNLAKALLDSLVGNAFEDDHQVARLLVERREGERDGIWMRAEAVEG